MLEKDTLIKVLNRDNGRVGYVIPELGNLRRSFMEGETKEIPFHELQKLSWVPGGMAIIKDCLVIQNEEALKALVNGEVEPEYYYTKEDVEELLLRGSLAQLQDCLDFSPTGVIELVKSLAVSLELNDIAKRDAIFEATGFNVTSAIAINKETAEDAAPEATSGRRAAPITASTSTAAATPQRRTTPKYNVVITK